MENTDGMGLRTFYADMTDAGDTFIIQLLRKAAEIKELQQN